MLASPPKRDFVYEPVLPFYSSSSSCSGRPGAVYCYGPSRRRQRIRAISISVTRSFARATTLSFHMSICGVVTFMKHPELSAASSSTSGLDST